MSSRTTRPSPTNGPPSITRPSTIAAAVLLTVGAALGGSWLVIDSGHANAAVAAPEDTGDDIGSADEPVFTTVQPQRADLTIDHEATGEVTAVATQLVSSPVGGTVVEVVEPGSTVASVGVSVGSRVAESDDLLTLDSEEQIVTTSIPVADAVTLLVGDAVELMLPDRTVLPGEVRTLTLGTDASVRVAEIEFSAPAVSDSDTGTDTDTDTDEADVVRVDTTFVGMTVDVSWTETVAADVLTVPADTFRHLDDGSYVLDLLTADGTVSTVTVEPGRTVGNLVEVAAIPADADVIQP